MARFYKLCHARDCSRKTFYNDVHRQENIFMNIGLCCVDSREWGLECRIGVIGVLGCFALSR